MSKAKADYVLLLKAQRETSRGLLCDCYESDWLHLRHIDSINEVLFAIERDKDWVTIALTHRIDVPVEFLAGGK